MKNEFADWTSEELSYRIHMIKIELNAAYGANPVAEMVRVAELTKELEAIRAELAKRTPT